MIIKNVLKKIAYGVTALTIAFSSLTSPNVLAASNNIPIDIIRAQVTLGDVTLRTPTEEEQKLIDSGKIEQIKVDNLEDYIINIEKGTFDITDNVNDIELPQQRGLSGIAKKTIGVDPIPIPPVWINCQFEYTSAQIQYIGDYYFTSISNINSWLSGLTFPVKYTWSQKSSSYTLSNLKRNVKINVNGVLGTHIIVSGVGQILEQNMSYSFDFTARK